ncbi:AraC family transcriptional regulator [Carboxylicivirga sp. M1479]|uniref:helix-turn-helix domain-containing protein n=1 Tax=Carboxylicivirga sp. M1479 TaxID=2594476 RepID=UPI0011776AA7|nr:AraC family transcriptional regulator [Carboxylicivirga sp. M1479]TRX72684.1 helix-turn-helix transcriptional regulator [Carboxylicivirga sp. M1479]
MPDKTIVKTKEGPAINYYQALQKLFGGSVNNGEYQVKNALVDIHMSAYQYEQDIELLIASGTCSNAMEIDREPDDDPNYIHINIIKEGQLTQFYSNQKQLDEADTSKGVFVYNGLFPLKAEIPARINYKSVAFKFNKRALEKLIPEAVYIFDELFGDQQPIAYHMQASKEIERLTDDIFYFRDVEFGGQMMVMARGFEVFSSLFLSAKNHFENNNLHGLHVDDYERLLKIKEKLLSSFDQRISLDDIAQEFGISVSKLKRDFKALFDCSLYQFYTHAKMDEAYRLLKTGNYSVMDVGYDLGYQNLSKFSMMFKKVKGISPKDIIPIKV